MLISENQMSYQCLPRKMDMAGEISHFRAFILFYAAVLIFGGHQTSIGQDESWQRIRERIKREPGNSDAYRSLIEHAAATNSFSAAILFLETRRKAGVDDEVLLNSLAHCYLYDRQPEKAEQIWRTCLERRPVSFNYTYQLSRLRRLAGHADQALDLWCRWDTAVQETPDFTSAPVPPLVVAELFTTCGDACKQAVDTGKPLANPTAVASLFDKFVAWTTLPAFIHPQVDIGPGSFDSMLQTIRERFPNARALNQLLNDPKLVCHVFTQLGLCAVNEGNLAATEYCFVQAVDLACEMDDAVVIGDTHGNLAKCLMMAGRYDEAAECIKRVLDASEQLSSESDSSLNYANGLLHASTIAWALGRPTESIGYLYRARDRFHAHMVRDPNNVLVFNSVVAVLTGLAERHLTMGNEVEAELDINRLRDLINGKLIYPHTTPRIEQQLLQARVALRRKKIKDARSYIESAKELAQTLPNAGERPTLPVVKSRECRLADIHALELRVASAERADPWYRLNVTSNALSLIYHLIETRNVLLRDVALQVSLCLIDVYLELKDNANAAKIIRNTKQIIPKHDYRGWGALLLQREGRLADRCGRPDVAANYYSKMLQALAMLRGDLPPTADLMHLERELWSSFREAIGFYLRQGRFESALRALEFARAHSLLRSLQLFDHDNNGMGELRAISWQRYTLRKQLETLPPHDPRCALLEEQVAHLSERYRAQFQQHASHGAAIEASTTAEDLLESVSNVQGKIVVLWFDVEARELTRFWIEAGILEGASTDTVDANALLADLAAFSSATKYGETAVRLTEGERTYTSAAQSIAKRLLPELTSLADGTRLTIIPDARLQEVPFAALWVDNRPLIAQKIRALAFAPSISILSNISHRTARRRPKRMVFISGRDYDTDAPLDAVSTLQKLRPIVESSGTKLTELGITRPVERGELIEAIRDQDLVIVKAHGKLNRSNPMAGFIKLSPDEVLPAHALFEWRIPGSIVVLAACQVGGDVGIETEDVLGMTYPLLAAGARCAVHAQWSILEPVTDEFLVEFLHALHTGATSAEALVAAQRRVMTMNNGRYSRPEWWAGWRVVGHGS